MNAIPTPSIPTPPFLVTAGGTREAIDRVRDWGNAFTGNTGYAIAKALGDLGPVVLMTSNAAHVADIRHGQLARYPIRAVPFRSYDDLRAELERAMAADRYAGVFMTAAVSDYMPDGAFQVMDRRAGDDGTETWTVRPAQAGKVKSTFERLAVLGRRTEKLVDLFRSRWGFKGLLVKFKLEVGVSRDRLVEIGQASRTASGADYLVANTLDMVGGPGAGAYLLSETGAEWVVRADLPARLRDVTAARLVTP